MPRGAQIGRPVVAIATRTPPQSTPVRFTDASAIRSATMTDLDLTKRDMTLTYGERTFALRAYREDGAWHSVVIEHKTPLRTDLTPAADAASCLAAAVQVVAT